ncbi:hypothetical protein JW921_06805 [Candidatus Fermentibacterales bacterium]|nr:hypothetical protein [Candidatus Fermentibacterales bacterium]
MTSIPDERTAALRQLEKLLHAIGSANDAEDHGYIREAERIRRESCEAILALLDEHAFVPEVLPGIRLEVETGDMLWFRWSSFLARVERLLEQRGIHERHGGELG